MWRSWVLALSLSPILCAAAPKPADWVPVRWPWADALSLDLLQGSPVNCLLLRNLPADLIAAAAQRGLVTLAVLAPGTETVADARKAIAAKVNGIVLEGDFPESAVTAVREVAAGATVI